MLAILLACADPAPVQAGADEPVEPSTPYIYEEDEADEGRLSLDEVSAGIEAGIHAVLALDPRPLHAAYREVVALAESDCPYFYPDYEELYGYAYWVDTCETRAGARFAGNGRHYHYDPYVDGYYDWAWRDYFYGAAKITDAEGRSFVGSGYASAYEYTNTSNGYRYFYNYTYGDFRWDGDEGTWLGSELSVVNYLTANQAPAGGNALYLDASIAGLDDSVAGVNGVVFEQVYAFDELRGSPCPIEPSGMISVRDAQGDWYDVELQGPDVGATAMFPPDCDGCGQVYLRGELLGEVCPDFSPLLVWSESPWG